MAEPSMSFPVFREYADGACWLGGCLVIELVTQSIHSHMGAYLVRGSDAVAMVDTGHPMNWATLRENLAGYLDGRPVDYVVPTHQEYPHAGNLPGLLAEYPELRVVGDVRDYHLYYPEHADRFEQRHAGDVIQLGDRELHLLPAPLHDLPSTLWAYDTASRSMFVSDGFTYSHEHLSGECTLLSSELGRVPSEQDILFANESALHFTKYVDTNPLFDEIAALLRRYPTAYIGPAHGNVIDQPDPVLALMKAQLAGLRRFGREPE